MMPNADNATAGYLASIFYLKLHQALRKGKYIVVLKELGDKLIVGVYKLNIHPHLYDNQELSAGGCATHWYLGACYRREHEMLCCTEWDSSLVTWVALNGTFAGAPHNELLSPMKVRNFSIGVTPLESKTTDGILSSPAMHSEKICDFCGWRGNIIYV